MKKYMGGPGKGGCAKYMQALLDIYGVIIPPIYYKIWKTYHCIGHSELKFVYLL